MNNIRKTEEIVHGYLPSHVFGLSECGLDYDKLKDHSGGIKWVTCKRCLKAINQHKRD